MIDGTQPSGVGVGDLFVRVINPSDRPAHDVQVEARRLDGQIHRGGTETLDANGGWIQVPAGRGETVDIITPGRQFDQVLVRYSDAFGFAHYELRWGAPNWQARSRRVT